MVTLARCAHVRFPGSLVNWRSRVCATSAVSADRSFDGRGNYSLGVREQIIFQEIEYDKVDKIRA